MNKPKMQMTALLATLVMASGANGYGANCDYPSGFIGPLPKECYEPLNAPAAQPAAAPAPGNSSAELLDQTLALTSSCSNLTGNCPGVTQPALPKDYSVTYTANSQPTICSANQCLSMDACQKNAACSLALKKAQPPAQASAPLAAAPIAAQNMAPKNPLVNPYSRTLPSGGSSPALSAPLGLPAQPAADTSISEDYSNLEQGVVPVEVPNLDEYSASGLISGGDGSFDTLPDGVQRMNRAIDNIDAALDSSAKFASPPVDLAPRGSQFFKAIGRNNP